MSFVHPGWLALLLILPFFLLGALFARRSRRKAWKMLVAPRLRSQLVTESSSTRSWISLILALIGTALLIIVIARPYRGKISTVEHIKTRNILIAIDTSRSMLVKDVSPNRMAAAKAIALELLDAFPDDRVGIIAFSGVPILMVPFTIDHAAVHESIAQLDTDIIPTGGSDLNAAVDLALQTFQKTGQKSNALIIISDGENHSQHTESNIDAIRDANLLVCSISVGTALGGIIPDPKKNDGKFRDYKGHTVLSRMIPDDLDSLSRAGNGIYTPASSGASATISATLASIKRYQELGKKRLIPDEKYQWFLAPSIFCLLLSLLVRSQLFTRKKLSPSVASLLIPLFFLFAPFQNLYAGTLKNATKAYRNKNYPTALTLFKIARKTSSGEAKHRINFALGATTYRLHQWDKAAFYFSESLLSADSRVQENAHYNLAQSLFRSGLKTLRPQLENDNDFPHLFRKLFGHRHGTNLSTPLPTEKLKKITTLWKDSIDHYQSALTLNPHNQQSADNQEKVKRLLAELLRSEQEKRRKKEKNKKNKNQHNPKTDPKQQKEKKSQNKEKDNTPDKTSGKEKKGKKNDKKLKKDSNNQSNNKSSKPPSDSDKKNKPNLNRKKGEDDKAYSARILKENSDAEIRPVQRPKIIQRRHAYDW